MPRFDLAMITTVEADTYEEACEWLYDFANGLADNEQMPITSEYPGMPTILPTGQRLIVLMPLTPEGATNLHPDFPVPNAND